MIQLWAWCPSRWGGTITTPKKYKKKIQGRPGTRKSVQKVKGIAIPSGRGYGRTRGERGEWEGQNPKKKTQRQPTQQKTQKKKQKKQKKTRQKKNNTTKTQKTPGVVGWGKIKFGEHRGTMYKAPYGLREGEKGTHAAIIRHGHRKGNVSVKLGKTSIWDKRGGRGKRRGGRRASKHRYMGAQGPVKVINETISQTH